MDSSPEGETVAESEPTPDSGPADHRYVGIDVGGTSIKIGLVSGAGTVLREFSIPTRNELGPVDAISRIRDVLQDDLEPNGQSVKAVGLGTPGPLDSRNGMILDPVNMPGWRNFPVRDELSQALQRPVVYVNDANAAAFGEYWIGTGKHYHSLVLLTLGTGVGAGIISDNRLLSGSIDHAAECGHVAVEYGPGSRVCSCGKSGHLEAWCSASAVAARAREMAKSSPSGLLAKRLEIADTLTARDVYDCAVQNDPDAIELIDQTAHFLARGIRDLVHTVDPQIVLLGGAMNFGGSKTAIGQRFLGRIDEEVREGVFSRIADRLKIEFASLAGSAGWIGAAGLAKRDYDQTI